METKPYPPAPFWESREDFSVLCRGTVIDVKKEFQILYPDGKTALESFARFHYQCWVGEIPEGKDVVLPSSRTQGRHPANCYLRTTPKSRPRRNWRRVMIPFDVSINTRTRELEAAEGTKVEVLANGRIDISSPGRYRLVISEEELHAWAFDRELACQALTLLHSRAKPFRKHRRNDQVIVRESQAAARSNIRRKK